MSKRTNQKILDSIKEAEKTWSGNEPHILAFICDWCHNENTNQLEDYPDAHIIPVRCTGRIDQLHILQAFWTGADGVLLIGCHRSDCHYISGASATEKRIEEIKEWLRAVEIEPERLQIEQISAEDKPDLSEILMNFASNLKEMGVNPLQKTV